MMGSNVRIPGIRWVLAFIAAAMFAVAGAPGALAQQDDQYDGTVAPSGPVAGAQCAVAGDTDGVVNAGDTVECGGEFSIAEGASVTLEDSDGTQGTFVDGENAEITEGSIIIQVTGEPFGVAGGNGVLNTDGLFVVATTGIFAADDDGAGDDGAGAGAGAGTDDGATAGASTDGATAGASTGDGAAAQASTGEEVASIAGEGAVAGAGDDAAAEDGAGIAVLPDTGGSIMALVLAGGLLLLGAGFVIRRLAGSN